MSVIKSGRKPVDGEATDAAVGGVVDDEVEKGVDDGDGVKVVVGGDVDDVVPGAVVEAVSEGRFDKEAAMSVPSLTTLSP